ncbi:MAG: LEPR-XLL domain-containing protein, partial [Planctomycetota bacterium]
MLATSLGETSKDSPGVEDFDSTSTYESKSLPFNLLSIGSINMRRLRKRLQRQLLTKLISKKSHRRSTARPQWTLASLEPRLMLAGDAGAAVADGATIAAETATAGATDHSPAHERIQNRQRVEQV